MDGMGIVRELFGARKCFCQSSKSARVMKKQWQYLLHLLKKKKLQ